MTRAYAQRGVLLWGDIISDTLEPSEVYFIYVQ